jgi:uncharacterized protein YfdQ (DUF2303 family)
VSNRYNYSEGSAPVLGDVQAAMAAGAALGDPRTPVVDEKAGVFAVVPKDYDVKSLNDYLPRPLRIEQQVALHDADSFIAYVNEFKSSATHIFFNAQAEEFTAILDYHEGTGAPAWCDHAAVFQPRRSVEFTTWLDQNRKQMTQVEFARFLEENLPDIVEPSSAELLQVALTFEAKKSVEFSSGVRLNNGQIQFQYDEVVRGTAQKGTMEVPEVFTIGVSIHMNGPAYRIPVRLRWRLHEGKVAFWYEVVRPHKYIEDALKEIRDRITEKTSLALLAGVAE